MAIHRETLELVVQGLQQVNALNRAVDDLARKITAVNQKASQVDVRFAARGQALSQQAQQVSEIRSSGRFEDPLVDDALKRVLNITRRTKQANERRRQERRGQYQQQIREIAQNIESIALQRGGAQANIADLEKDIYNQLKLGSATNLYRRRMAAIGPRAGGLTPEQKEAVANVDRAFQLLNQNAKVVNAYATELGRIVEVRNAQDRTSTRSQRLVNRRLDYDARTKRLFERGDITESEQAKLLRRGDRIGEMVEQQRFIAGQGSASYYARALGQFERRAKQRKIAAGAEGKIRGATDAMQAAGMALQSSQEINPLDALAEEMDARNEAIRQSGKALSERVKADNRAWARLQQESRQRAAAKRRGAIADRKIRGATGALEAAGQRFASLQGPNPLDVLQAQIEGQSAASREVGSALKARIRSDESSWKQLVSQAKQKSARRTDPTLAISTELNRIDTLIANLDKLPEEAAGRVRTLREELQGFRASTAARRSGPSTAITPRVLGDIEQTRINYASEFQKLKAEFPASRTGSGGAGGGRPEDAITNENRRAAQVGRLKVIQAELNKLELSGIDTSRQRARVEAQIVELEQLQNKATKDGLNLSSRGVAIEENRLRRKKIGLSTENAANKIRQDAADARAQKFESLALGAGFPLLFGGGAGSVIGSIAGSFVGSGFGGQILGGAIGQIIDKYVQGLGGLASGLKDPTKALEGMRTAGLYVSSTLENNVRVLTEVGRGYEAQAVVLAEVEKQLGKGSAQNLAALNAQQTELQKQWSQLTATLASGVLPALVAVTAGLNEIIKVASLFPQIPDLTKPGNIARFAPLAGFVPGGTGAYAAIAGFQAIQNRGRDIAKNTPPTQITPEQEAAFRKSRIDEERRLQDEVISNEAARLSLRRSAQDLDFQLIDKQRAEADYARSVAEFRFRLESQIAQKAEDAAMAQANVARQRAALAIAEASRAADQRIYGVGEGRAAQILQAEKEFLQQKATGEADQAQLKIRTEVNIARLRRDQTQFEQSVTKEKEGLERSRDGLIRQRLQFERSIEDYKIQVAQYQLKISREMADNAYKANQQLAAMAGTSGSTVAGGGGVPGSSAQVSGGGVGMRGNTVVGFPITSYPGPRNGRIHGGLDIGMPVGTPISFTRPGRITDSGYQGGYGNYIKATLDNGVKAFFAHLSEIVLAKGRTFAANQLVAKSGSTGRSSGPHVHSGDYSNVDPYSSLPYTRFGGRVGAMVSAGAMQGPNTMPSRPIGTQAVRNGKRVQWNGVGWSPVQEAAGLTPGAAPSFGPIPAAPKGPALPGVPGVGAAVAATASATDKQVAAERALLDIEKQLADVKAGAAFDALLRAAEGPKVLRQKQNELDLAQAALKAGAGMSEMEAARLELKARSLELLKQEGRENEIYLKDSQLTGDARAKAEAALAARLQNLREELSISEKLLQVEQQRALAGELRGAANSIRYFGGGIRAGYGAGTGAANAYDSAMQKTGDPGYAKTYADSMRVMDRLQQAQSDASGMAGSIGGGLREAIKAAVTGGDVKGALGSMLGELGSKFLESAFRPVEEMLSKQLFSLLAPSQTEQMAAANSLMAASQNLTAGTTMLTASTNFLTAAATMSSSGVAGGLTGSLASGITGSLSSIGPSVAQAGFGLAQSLVSPLQNIPMFFDTGGKPPVLQASVVGEHGPELFMPTVPGTISSPEKTKELFEAAKERRRSGGGEPVRFETINIGKMEFVTREEAIKIGQRAARAGHQMTMNKQRNSLSYRGQVGMD